MWTLEYNGVEREFKDWGLALQPSTLSRVNQGPDILAVEAKGSMDAALLFPWAAAVVVRKDGVTYFRGRATTPQRSSAGTRESITYQFAGPWWDLERLVFQQYWKVYTGDVNNLATVYTSELFLGQKVTGEKQTASEQVREILLYAASCGVALQLGTIDAGPDVPIYNVRDVTCAEAIIQMLRWGADAVWFDYSTSPPTVHVRNWENLATVLVSAATHEIATPLDLVPRYDLQLPAVLLRFKRLSEADGQSWVNLITDRHPVTATGQEWNASVHTIELAGMRQTTVQAVLECQPVLAQSPAESVRIAWWKTKNQLLRSAKVNPSSIAITSANVKEEVNDVELDVNLATYPNELVKGQVADWMAGFAQKHVTVKAVAKYDLYLDDNGWSSADPAASLLRRVTEVITARIVVTNATTGTYTAVESFEEAEAVPVGLAQSIYNSHNILHHDGQLTVAGPEVPAGLGVGNRVTLDTGTATYQNMMVQQSVEDMGLGRVTLTLGAPTQLGVSDLIELLRVNRYRYIYNMPSSRTTGHPGGGGQVGLGKETPKENTVAGLGKKEYEVLVKEDADGVAEAKVVHEPNEVKVLMPSTPAAQRVMKPRKFLICDPSTGVEQYVVLQAGPPF